MDRVFTIQGTGTVVTGTLWSGTLRAGDRVRILPQDLEGRVRGVEVHGSPADAARAGERTAVALAGSGADRDVVGRGSTLVTAGSWTPTWMVTARVQVLGDSDWGITHNQRVHVHHGTAQVLARCALLEQDDLGPGDVGWVQLRLEAPLVVRGRDRLILRSYSPVTTIAGGAVAESHPPKRNQLDDAVTVCLDMVLDGADSEALAGLLELAAWTGLEVPEVAIRSGLSPARIGAALEELASGGVRTMGSRVFSAGTWSDARRRILAAVAGQHASDPSRSVVPLAAIRTAIPDWAPAGVADAVIQDLVAEGALLVEKGGVRTPDHEPRLTRDQEEASASLYRILADGGLAPPFVEELPEPLVGRADLWSILHWLEAEGRLEQVADNLYIASEHVHAAEASVRAVLGGRTGLGPADFRDALDVTRKHLIPLLNFFDVRGTTLRLDDGRSVPKD